MELLFSETDTAAIDNFVDAQTAYLGEKEEKQKSMLKRSLQKFKKKFYQKYENILQELRAHAVEPVIFLQLFEGEIKKINDVLKGSELRNSFIRKHVEHNLDICLNFIEKHFQHALSEIDENPLDYPDIQDEKFNEKIYFKKEFNKHKQTPKNNRKKKTSGFTLSNSQAFLKKYMSQKTPYNGIIIIHGVGVGKTCTGISIAENFKNKMIATKKKIYIFTPSETLSETWKKEIFNIDREKAKTKSTQDMNVQCTGKDYSKYYQSLSSTSDYGKEIKMNKFIKEIYEIMGYQQLANRVEKRANELTTESLTFDQALIKTITHTYSNSVIVMDEVHETRISGTTNKNKRAPPYLELIARYCTNVKLVLLSATPIFNESTEILWLLNLLLLNDKKAPIFEEDVFKTVKNISKLKDDDGRLHLIKKSRGYISYLRGNNPSVFPTRLYPSKEVTYFYNSEQNKISWQKPKSTSAGAATNAKKWIKKQLIDVPIWAQQDIVLCNHFMSDLQATRFIEASRNKKGEFGQRGITQSLIGLNTTELGEKNKLYPVKKKNRYLIPSGDQFKYNPTCEDAIQKDVAFLHHSRIGKYSTKYQALCHLISQSDGTIFIYSQSKQVGIKTISMMLEENGMTRYVDSESKQQFEPFLSEVNSTPETQIFKGLSYIYVDGDIDNAIVNEWFDHYNKNNIEVMPGIHGKNIKVILGSDKVAQGVNLFRIREVHIMGPWLNLNKTEQIIGRGTRSYGHHLLTESKRNITIYLHTSYIPPNSSEEIKTLLGKKGILSADEIVESLSYFSADQYNYLISYRKKIRELQVLQILIQNAIDCDLNIYLNNVKHRKVQLIDSQNHHREYKKANTCALLNVTTQQYCKNNMEITCIQNLKDSTRTKLDNSTYDYILFGSSEVSEAKYFIKQIFRNVYIQTLAELEQAYKEYLKYEAESYEEEYFYLALNELIKEEELFMNQFGQEGFLLHVTTQPEERHGSGNFIQKQSSVYIFQPTSFRKLGVPFIYRYYDFITKGKFQPRESKTEKDKGKEKEILQPEIETKVSSPKQKGTDTGGGGGGGGGSKLSSIKSKGTQIHPGFAVSKRSENIMNIQMSVLKTVLFNIQKTFFIEDKNQFLKDTIPFYPSALSTIPYMGHMCAFITTVIRRETKDAKLIAKRAKQPVHDITESVLRLVHTINVNDTKIQGLVLEETDTMLKIKNKEKISWNGVTQDKLVLDKQTLKLEEIIAEMNSNKQNIKNKHTIMFYELEELLRTLTLEEIYKELSLPADVELAKKIMYLNYLGYYRSERLCIYHNSTKRNLTLEQCKEACMHKRSIFINIDSDLGEYFMDMDRLSRFYIIDRLQITEKKVLLEYILHKYIVNKKGLKKKYRELTKEELSSGVHHIIDFFFQTLGLNNIPLYILDYEGHIYFRLYSIIEEGNKQKNTTILYYDSVDGTLVTSTLQAKLEAVFPIQKQDVELFKYCNYYGLLESDIVASGEKQRTFLGSEYKLNHKFMYQDCNIADVKLKGRQSGKRRGTNVRTVSKLTYKGRSNNETTALKAVRLLTLDLYQHIFNMPVLKQSELSEEHKNYIVVREAKVFAEMIFEEKDGAVNVPSFGKMVYIVKVELLLRYYRNILQLYSQLGQRKTPTFWFFTGDECNCRYRFSQDPTEWMRNYDYVAAMCRMFNNIIDKSKKGTLKCMTSKCKSTDTDKDLYFNDTEIACSTHAQPDMHPIPPDPTKKTLSNVFQYTNLNFVPCIFE
jgi:hypothetical protein